MAPKIMRQSIQYIAGKAWFAKVGRRVIPPLDKALYKVSKGRVGTMTGTGFNGLLLTTVGRKTGQERSVPLLYVPHDGKYYLTGSNWGQDHHPVWTLNLLANPEAKLTIKGKVIPVTARMLEGDERLEMWKVLIHTWPNYDIYTERSGRELRVFELTER